MWLAQAMRHKVPAWALAVCSPSWGAWAPSPVVSIIMLVYVVLLDGLLLPCAIIFTFTMGLCCHVVVVLGPPSSLAGTDVLWLLHLTMVWLVLEAVTESPLTMFSMSGGWLVVQCEDHLDLLGRTSSGSLLDPLQVEFHSIVSTMVGNRAACLLKGL